MANENNEIGQEINESVSIDELAKKFPKYTGKKEDVETAIKVLEKTVSRIATTERTYTDDAKAFIESQGMEGTPEAVALLKYNEEKDKKEARILIGTGRQSNSVRNSINSTLKILRAIKQ